MSFPAIVLAAGASRRLGQSKQLLKHGHETLLQRAMRLAREAGASPVFAVLGANFDIVSASVPFQHSIRVFNKHWEQGIASSIHAGLHALDEHEPEAEAALLMACDQPRLTADHLRNLMARFAAQKTACIVASAYAEVLGVPAIFPRAVFPELLALRGDKGARALLEHAPCPAIPVAFAGGEIDIDSPEDLEHLE